MTGNGFVVGLAIGCVANSILYAVTGYAGFIVAAAVGLVVAWIVTVLVNG